MFLVAVSVAFVLLIVHALLQHGKKFTAAFFGGGLLFGFVREFLYDRFVHKYSFPGLSPSLFGVSVVIPVGWVFMFYLAHEFTRRVVTPTGEQAMYRFILIAGVFSNFICIPIETAAMNMGWWQLHNEDWVINDAVAPVGLMSGWWYTTVLFFFLYFVASKKLAPKHLAIPGAIATITLFVEWGHFLGWIFIVVAAVFLLSVNRTFFALGLTYIGLTIVLPHFLPAWPNSIFVTLTYGLGFGVILPALRGERQVSRAPFSRPKGLEREAREKHQKQAYAQFQSRLDAARATEDSDPSESPDPLESSPNSLDEDS